MGEQIPQKRNLNNTFSMFLVYDKQGSHSSWKTWKMTIVFPVLEKYWNFIILLKSWKNGSEPGKMNCLGKNSFKLIVAAFISAV